MKKMKLPIEAKFENVDEIMLDKLVDTYVELVDSPLLPLMSIRLLKTMVKRLFYRTQTFVRRNPYVKQPADLDTNFKSWVEDIRDEMLPSLKADPLEALLRERGIF